MTYAAWRDYLERVVSRPELDINLAEAALILASDEYPQLSVPAYLDRLREMGEVLRLRLPVGREPVATIASLNTYLFVELGFHGNLDDYYDPRNSFLNEVLDRRTGLPISLSVVVLALAKQLDLPIYGVGLPGHFVVKWQDASGEYVFDPFNQGELLDVNGVEKRVQEIQPLARYHPGWLNAVGAKYILVRMLQNLKAVYVRNEQLEHAWRVVDKLLLLDPRAGDEIRDFGLLSLRLGRFKQAAISLEQYLLSHADAPDADLMRVYLRRALEQVERLN